MNEQTDTQNVLIVDDETVVRNGIGRALERKGLRTRQAANGREALELLDNQPFDLVLLDIRMPDMDGIQVLKEIRANHPKTEIIMITGYPTIDSAVHCVKLGALDYLVKPFRLDDLEAALNKTSRKSGNDTIDTSVIDDNGMQIDSAKNFIIGQSRPMKTIFEKILKVAPTDSTVLISGESGTGKSTVHPW